MSFWKRIIRRRKQPSAQALETTAKSEAPLLSLASQDVRLGDALLGKPPSRESHAHDSGLPAYERQRPRDIFQTLPPEIIHCILDHCSIVGTLSLRFCSRRLFEVIPPQSASSLEKNLFWRLLKKDHFHQLCDLEETGQHAVSLDVALCSNCIETHSLDLFTHTQLSAPSRRRVCRSIEGRLRVCEHTSSDFHAIRNAARKGLYACTDSAHREMSLVARPNPEWVQHIGGHLMLRTEYVVGGWEADSTPPRSDLVKAVQLALDRAEICPHTRGRDIASALLKKEQLGPPGTRGSSVICGNLHCHTTVVVTFRYPLGDRSDIIYVLAEVTRALGALREPTDKPWLAQIGQ